MLVEFKVKNFRSFKEQQTFSMVASADKSRPDNATPQPVVGKSRLLHSAVVYGANASGKSNLVTALDFVLRFVLTSASRRPAQERGRSTAIEVRPFMLDQSTAASPSEFELTFIHKEVRYQYGFAVDQQRVHQEWLIAYPKGLPQTWFERTFRPEEDSYDWHFGPRLGGEKRRLEDITRPDVLFLSIGATFNHKQLSDVYEWFENRLNTFDGRKTSSYLSIAQQIMNEEGLQEEVTRLLRIADLGIWSFSVDRIEINKENMTANFFDGLNAFFEEGALFRYDVKMFHLSTGDGTVPLQVEEESFGTQRLFILSAPWLYTLLKGYILVIDELDASLHPLLVRTLVAMFHNPAINRHGAQLIFNTHDTTLLDDELFRRDQIWFVEKDRAGASHLYPLLDFSPRKGEALEKNYLQGRYGAIPFIGQLPAGFLSHAEG